MQEPNAHAVDTHKSWFSIFRDPIILGLTVAFVIGVGAVWWYLNRSQSQLVNSMALENAQAYSQAIKEFRSLYTSEVVTRAKSQGLEITHDYELKPGALPLPATLSMKLGEAFGKDQSAAQTKLYSAFPFPWREKSGGLQDQFQKDAWGALNTNPDQPFYRIENYQGRPTLRYATADIMRAECVGCHNSHPQTPKTGWKAGDLRGVVEVAQPLDSMVAQANASMAGITKLLGGIGLGGMIMLFVVFGRVRRNLDESERRAAEMANEVSERQQAQQKIEREMAERQTAERKIMEAVNVLGSSTNELLTAVSQMAASASEMASSVQETTSTVEEVKQTASLSSQKAQQVSEEAGQAARISQLGLTATEGTISEMTRVKNQMQAVAESILRLNEHNQVVGEIITTVNDLAEQSNLLAINASIEAQRAGEHGSGFAVVAQEVRGLAQQSKLATIQVQDILSDIEKATSAAVLITEQGTKATETGMQQSEEAGTSIRTLAENVSGAAQTTAQIVSSSQQQVTGMDQVLQAMLNIQEGTKQTSESISQIESTARELYMLGQQLQELGQQFHAEETPAPDMDLAA